MAVMQGMMSKLKLTVDEERTRLCLLPEESFDPHLDSTTDKNQR